MTTLHAEADRFSDAALFRAEEAGRPNAGDLLQPGMLIRTSWGTGPYRIEAVTPWEQRPGYRCWSLALSLVEEGVVTRRGFTVNDIVAVWEGDTVRFLNLVKGRRDEVFIVEGVAFAANRGGQFDLF